MPGAAEGENELNQHERERVIELMLSQERVISLLYDKTFPMTSLEMQNGQGLQDMENAENEGQQNQEEYGDEDGDDQEEEENYQEQDQDQDQD